MPEIFLKICHGSAINLLIHSMNFAYSPGRSVTSEPRINLSLCSCVRIREHVAIPTGFNPLRCSEVICECMFLDTLLFVLEEFFPRFYAQCNLLRFNDCKAGCRVITAAGLPNIFALHTHRRIITKN